MINPISIITCCVGIIGCVIGVATFVSAQITRAKQDGALMEKVDYLIRGFDEQKKDSKERYNAFDTVLDEHTKDITDVKARVRNLEKEVFKN